MENRNDVKSHDIFNIISLSVICVVDFWLLLISTDWDLMGTSQLGLPFIGESNALLAIFSIYLLIDTIWIVVKPKCTVTASSSILWHHAITFLALSTPWFYPQFRWHFAMSLTVEFSTLFLTLGRNTQHGGLTNSICTILFYSTWVLVRLILFPALLVFNFFEYVRYSEETGSFFNVVIVSCACQGIITLLSLQWTWEKLDKIWGRKSKSNIS